MVGDHHALGLAAWTVRPADDHLAVRRYAPVSTADLEAILDKPEPWYGRRWARWNLGWRAREAVARERRPSGSRRP
ncbi:MAG: hypothetical protein JO291_14090 [Acidimicrobiia bacterium]|nr:hypothetical protein [Acidimicrobiia bacterium]